MSKAKSTYQEKIINLLRKERLDRHYSQGRIADILGISYGQMGNIESSKFKAKYTLEQIYTLCKNFRINISDVFLSQEDFANNKNIIDNLITNIIKYETGK